MFAFLKRARIGELKEDADAERAVEYEVSWRNGCNRMGGEGVDGGR